MDLVTRNVGSNSVSWLVWDRAGGTLHIFLKGQGDLDRFKQEMGSRVAFFPSADASGHVALHAEIERATDLVNSLDLPHEHLCKSVAMSGDPGGGLSGSELDSVLMTLKKMKFISFADFGAISSGQY